MSNTREATVSCPRPDCEGEVAVTLEWEPADWNYGADADGNRGMYVRGYYWSAATGPSCSEGHVFFADERVVLDKVAADEAGDYYAIEDEYDSPDCDDYDDR